MELFICIEGHLKKSTYEITFESAYNTEAPLKSSNPSLTFIRKFMAYKTIKMRDTKESMC